MVFAKVVIGDSRTMTEVKDNSIALVVTSPPYWHIKDYGVEGQIGYGQSLHEYLKNLFIVWKECYRILKPGTRLCINIGDQFLRSVIYGRYKIAPLHSEFIIQCEKIGFDYMGSIIWQKKTTMNTTGGASVMGSYPYPPNGLIEIDYEFILIFKKPGKIDSTREVKEKSKLTKEEWKEYFSGHWNFNGEKQEGHEAMFPEELPKRLIKMFTFVDDIVLDPFLGSGTTIKAALNLNRNSIGYEINEKFLPLIKAKVEEAMFSSNNQLEIIKQNKPISIESNIDYVPNIKDAKPIMSPDKLNFTKERLYKVVNVVSDDTIELDTGLKVKLLGVSCIPKQSREAINYLEKYVKGKQVFIKFDPLFKPNEDLLAAYVFLKNRIFVNKEMIKQGLARIPEYDFKYKNNFTKLMAGTING
ncbi:MAG: DNA methyltransferase [Candidatus Diapherotrites archaeon]